MKFFIISNGSYVIDNKVNAVRGIHVNIILSVCDSRYVGVGYSVTNTVGAEIKNFCPYCIGFILEMGAV